MKTFTYQGHKVVLSATRYNNNNTLAIAMDTKDGESYDVITRNLNHPLQSDTMAFLDTNNHPEIEKFIKKHRLGVPMGVLQSSGFCSYPLYTIFTDRF